MCNIQAGCQMISRYTCTWLSLKYHDSQRMKINHPIEYCIIIRINEFFCVFY